MQKHLIFYRVGTETIDIMGVPIFAWMQSNIIFDYVAIADQTSLRGQVFPFAFIAGKNKTPTLSHASITLEHFHQTQFPNMECWATLSLFPQPTKLLANCASRWLTFKHFDDRELAFAVVSDNLNG